MTVLDDPAVPVLFGGDSPFSPAPVDAELFDGYRLADGDLDTAVELPVPPVPALPPLTVEPPHVAPPSFEQVWRDLFGVTPEPSGRLPDLLAA